MARAGRNDLQAFLAVARERSFARAAAKLGVPQSALSQALRGLGARLGPRLPARTARSAAPTEAGERLLQTLGPAFDRINATLATLSEFRECPRAAVLPGGPGTSRRSGAAHGAQVPESSYVATRIPR